LLKENQFDRDYFYGKKKSNYSNYEKINFEKQFKSVINFIQKNQITGTFLDVGCAFGYLTQLMFPYFNEVHGCDISSFAINKAKRICSEVKYKIENLEKGLDYPDEYFDCITALDVLEHTSSIEISLNNLKSKLKKGGYLIISLPINNLIRKLLYFLDKDKTHISIPKEKELFNLINRYKLNVIEKKYFLPFPYFYEISGVPVEIQLYLKK